MHTKSDEVCDGKILHIYTIQKLCPLKIKSNQLPKPPHSLLKGKSLKSYIKSIQEFRKMSEQRNRLDEYNIALAEVTQIIREQVRLIENNPSACIEYKRRINRERWLFADAWNVIIGITVRNFQAEAGYQASSTTPLDNNAGMTNLGSRRRRQIIQAGYQASATPPNNAGTTTTGRQ